MQVEEKRNLRKRKPVTLKTIANRVGFAPCSISAVLNNSPAARGIPQHTKERVLQVAAQLKYQPNFAARSLRTRRTHSVAVMARDLSCARAACMVAGIERSTRGRGYLLVIAAWDGASGSLNEHFLQFRQRGVEGLILIDAAMQPDLSLPAVMVETTESLDVGGGMDGCHLQAQGESAAHALVDQIEAFARVSNACEGMFWQTPLIRATASLS
jgi:DNA-binding LacI/PurR family transcriptional regulator